MHGINAFHTLREAVKHRKGPKRIYAYNVPCKYIVIHCLGKTKRISTGYFITLERTNSCGKCCVTLR